MLISAILCTLRFDQWPDETSRWLESALPHCVFDSRQIETSHPKNGIPFARFREAYPAINVTHDFQRPIYFLKTKDAYFCGWCELDEDSQWLTLIPHPLSSASSRRWNYGTEVENLGRVVIVVTR